MDKFGIFNLLNSFLNLSSPQIDSKDGKPASQEKSAPSDFLSGLLNGLKSNNDKKEEQAPPVVSSPKQTTPLQRQMLSTMQAHDEIIKRINNKTKS